jgi:hypothetical protein
MCGVERGAGVRLGEGERVVKGGYDVLKKNRIEGSGYAFLIRAFQRSLI